MTGSLEPVLGGDDTIRRNFSKLEELYVRVQQLRDSVFGGSTSDTAPAQARVYNDANISIATGTVTALTFNTERWDTGNFHSTSADTSRLTAPTAGLYMIGGCVQFAANSTGRRQVGIRVNGSTFIDVIEPASTVSATQAAIFRVGDTHYQLAATDYVELVVLQTSGGNLNVVAAGNYSPEFWIVRLGSQA